MATSVRNWTASAPIPGTSGSAGAAEDVTAEDDDPASASAFEDPQPANPSTATTPTTARRTGAA
jgi:hypothetical protein